MLRNYFKTALRSLYRHRFFSAINIFGLAVSMSICMGIIMLVADQMMYDRYNTKRNRIYRVNSIPIGKDGLEMNETATTTLPLKQELLDNYTGLAKSVRIMRGFANNWIELDQNVNIPVSGYFADPEVLDMFEYELEYGNPQTALIDPFTVVLTRRAANKLFKQENPVGEVLKVGDDSYKITGVIRESSNKSHIVFDALASMATVKSMEASGKLTKELDNWNNYTQGWVYILLEESKGPKDIVPYLEQIQKKHYSKLSNPDDQWRMKYLLQPLMRITPGAFINNPIGPFLPWMFIYFFAGIAGVVMLTSCFNFTNLSIARSLTRAREIGIRKVTGAVRWQIFTQFLGESVFISMLSLGLALVLLVLLKPMILQLNFAQILKWDMEMNYYVFGAFVVLALFVGIIAGLFPALVLSSFQPAKVLKNLGSMKLFSRIGMRKALLVTQFTFSLIFILTVIVVYNQLKYYIRADHGFNMENKVVVQLNNTSPARLKNELLKYSNIETVTATSHIPAAGMTKASGYKKNLGDKEAITLCYYAVDEDYIRNMELDLIAGKNFIPQGGESNKNYIILSEKAVEAFQLGTPLEAIGQELIAESDSSRKKVIGVVKNYNHQMMMGKMDPVALISKTSEYSLLQVKYSGSYEDAGKSVEAAWAKINPTLKVDYKDFFDEIHKLYSIFFGDITNILMVISFLAILISCLGLLGMATYTTETRKKEISIRKVLGSDNGSLVFLLSKGFFMILLIAIFIGVPAAYFLNSLWLEQLAYHVEMDITVISLGITILIVFGIITIGSQTWKAAVVSPVENLKGE
jgi:putative ABC transport system permease protein